jgi:hypothetical protein
VFQEQSDAVTNKFKLACWVQQLLATIAGKTTAEGHRAHCPLADWDCQDERA